MALCTAADVEVRLQRDLTTDAPSISGTVDALIADAQAHIEAEVGRELESAARTETFDAARGALFLKWFPVTAIASVVEDGVTLTVDDDFKWYPHGTLVRISENTDYQIPWRSLYPQAVIVTYTGGYLAGTHDTDLEHLGSICAEVVARAIRRGADAAAVPAGAAGQVQSVSLEGSDSVTYATGGGSATLTGGLSQFVSLLDDERRQLARYKTPAIA